MRVYNGIKTGLNEAFIINQSIKDQLVKSDPTCAAIMKPVLRGEDLRPWYQENEGYWLICLPYGWTKNTFPGLEMSETQAWEKFSLHYPSIASYLLPFRDAGRNRQDKGQFWWELRPCDYYDAFEKPKIFWPNIAKFPRFSWDENKQFVNNKGFILLPTDKSILGILQSRVSWFCITRLCMSLGERAGLVRYQHNTHNLILLPIPACTDVQHDHIGKLAQQITEKAQQRYEVRRRTTHRIESDLGTTDRKPNQQLAEWWELPFKAFRDEVVKSFKRDIPVKDRDEWETLLRECTAEIEKLTGEIVVLETELNAAVYEAFGLNEAEIALIEQETKYQYGEW